MFLKKIEIEKFRCFENVVIDFSKNQMSSIFSIASINGGGKSTLLQFIFILLHCIIDENKKQFIQNLIGQMDTVTSDIKLVKFTIEDNGKEYDLEYIITPTKSKGKDFNLYLDLKEIELQIKEDAKNNKRYQNLLELNEKINATDRISPLQERQLKGLHRFINNNADDKLYQDAIKSNNIALYKKLITSILEKEILPENSLDELDTIYSSIEESIKKLEINLKKENILYITHLDNEKNVLLLKTEMSIDLLTKLSNKVFLNAPSSQVFLFLSEDGKKSIFNGISDYELYEMNISTAKEDLEGFCTYDFASTDIILKSFEHCSKEDLKINRKTGSYGNKYKILKKELKNFLDDKEISEDEEGKKVIFKLKNSNKILNPEDLSHGELKKLGIYIWLKYIVKKDAIILMDEIDIALHPKWQYELVNDLKDWSENSQVLLATHSPQILSSTYYKNIIALDKNDSEIKVKQYSNPPVDRDINAILFEVMGAPKFPKDLLELHKKYRKYIKDDKVNSKESIKLKKELLEHESENSSFFQDINFDLALKQ